MPAKRTTVAKVRIYSCANNWSRRRHLVFVEKEVSFVGIATLFPRSHEWDLETVIFFSLPTLRVAFCVSLRQEPHQGRASSCRSSHSAGRVASTRLICLSPSCRANEARGNQLPTAHSVRAHLRTRRCQRQAVIYNLSFSFLLPKVCVVSDPAEKQHE